MASNDSIAAGMATDSTALRVLVGRTELPPREGWDALLAAPAEPPESGAAQAGTRDLRATIRRVVALEEAAREVLVVSADVADRR